MYWLLGSESQLSIENKLYEAILKPIWACPTAHNENIEMLQRFRNKYLSIVVSAPWYVMIS